MDPKNLSTLNIQILALIGAVFVLIIFIIFLSFLIKLITKMGLIHTRKPSFIIAISLILFFGYLAFIRNILLLPNFEILTALTGLVYPITGILFIVGLWKMKRWGLYGLFAVTFLLQLSYVFSAKWAPFSLIYFIPLLPTLIYFKEMN